jgi:hypothetical protein
MPEELKQAPDDLVVTPGGHRARSMVTEVHPGEAVVETPEKGFAVVQQSSTRADNLAAIPVDQMVITPGGYRHRSLVHTIEPGHVLDGSAGRMRKLVHASGEMVADFGTIAEHAPGRPLMPENVFVPAEKVPALGTGWIVYASWTNNTGRTITSFKTTWIVPPPPATQSGQTIFLFNGIQNSTMIYQPVLQWGPSADGGGNFWSVASWYADGQGGQAFKTPLVRVNTGDVLVGVMTLTGQSNNLFSYNCQFQGIANTSLPIQNVQELTWSVQTLEAYGLTQCSDYPETCKTAMTGIEILTGGQEASISWQATNAITDCGQHTVVVSNASPGGEVDLFYTSSAILANKDTLGDTSPLSPMLASLNGRLYLTWRGDGNDNLNVMVSTDNGRTFGNKFVSGETSQQAPTLCAHNGNLYIAWKGDGNDNLNVAIVDISGNQITGFSNKVTLGDTSPLSPMLASLNGRLYLTWRGDGNDNLNVMVSTDNGRTFGNKFVSGETSTQAPTLCAHNGNLYIAWKGDGNDNLNVAIVDISGNQITGFSNKVTLGDTSPLSPMLASLNGRLYLTWRGDGNDNLNVMFSTDNGRTFGNKSTSPETSQQAPTLCAHNGGLYIAWKGDGNDNLNVASVCN